MLSLLIIYLLTARIILSNGHPIHCKQLKVLFYNYKEKVLLFSFINCLYIFIFHLGMMSTTASLGLILLWDVDAGLTQIDKYLYSTEDYIKVLSASHINTAYLIEAKNAVNSKSRAFNKH